MIIDGKSFSFPNVFKIIFENLIPNMEWIMAKSNGNIKNMAICLNRALFSIFSSVPNFLSILNLSLLSLDSDNSFNASIAALDIKKIIPR